MWSFTGVSIISDGKHCTTSAVDAGTDSGYHLLVVKGYSRTVQEIPNGDEISSGPFMVGGHRWYIRYCPNGYDLSSTHFISFYMGLWDDDAEVEEAAQAKFDFSFVDEVEYQKPMHIRATETCSFSSKGHLHGHSHFVRRDALQRSSHLKDDCFTIRCDIMVCKDPNTGDVPDIHQHFDRLLQNKVGADVTFEVNDETFAAHRCVLAARSKVFMAQLFGPMRESTSNVIQIKDMEPNVFAALLKFIYTDSLLEEGGHEQDAVQNLMWLQDLFVAADRYDLQRLKLLCEEHLCKEICVRSVASTLALAERHQCYRLKEACLKFIQVQSPKSLDKVMETDGWDHLTTTYPSVLKEIISKLASSQEEDKKRKR